MDNWITMEVPEYWICYLDYGDVSGYSDDEINRIERWMRDYKYISAGDSAGVGRFDGVICDLCEIIVEPKK